MKKTAFYIAAVAWLPLAPALAQDHALFETSSQNPFIQIYSLPSPAESPARARRGWAMHAAFDLTSNATLKERPSGEGIVLDGETYRTSVTLEYGVSQRLAAGIIVPLVAHSTGFMDSLVKDWHDLFGISNDIRDRFDNNALAYVYATAGDEVFALRDRGRGIGDVRLTADWRLAAAPSPARSLVLRSGLKLPSGSSSRLHGSGSTDVSLQLLSTDRQTLSAWNTTLAWMIGGMWLGEGEVLDELRRDLVVIGSVGISRPLWRRLSARLQLDGHSEFYDSELRQLGNSALQLTFGGSVELARGGRVDFAMVQNLSTDPTPDFSIHLGWRRGF